MNDTYVAGQGFGELVEGALAMIRQQRDDAQRVAEEAKAAFRQHAMDALVQRFPLLAELVSEDLITLQRNFDDEAEAYMQIPFCYSKKYWVLAFYERGGFTLISPDGSRYGLDPEASDFTVAGWLAEYEMRFTS